MKAIDTAAKHTRSRVKPGSQATKLFAKEDTRSLIFYDGFALIVLNKTHAAD